MRPMTSDCGGKIRDIYCGNEMCKLRKRRQYRFASKTTDMDDLDVALLVVLDGEESEEELNPRRSESDLFKKRTAEGAYQILICRHLYTNENKFREYFRLTPVLFDYVLGYIKDDLYSIPTNRVQNPLTPEQKLCLLLRFLATGESFRSLAFQFRICHSWISIVIRQVAESIVTRMLTLVMPQPTEEMFKTISRKYRSLWDFPNCVGAIDGKHVRIKAPKNSGSTFFNYKEFYSVVMLAIVDADNKFVAVDIGSYGREGDAGIYLKSRFGQKILKKEFNIPQPQPLPGMNILMPHVILGDEAFALHEHLMKPYPRNQSVTDKTKAIYNYRLSRARRTTENAFGILCAFFRIFFQPIATHPETTDKLILCACILYNLLREANILPTSTNSRGTYPLPTENLLPLIHNNVRGANIAVEIRETFKTYFNGPGAVAWQEEHYREN